MNKFCIKCECVIDEGELHVYREPDVNWESLKCDCGSEDLEDITPEWGIEQIRRAKKYFKATRNHASSRTMMARLDAAEDELEALIP